MPCFVSISVFFFFLLVTSFSLDVQPIKVVLGSYHTLILTGTVQCHTFITLWRKILTF